MTLILVFAMCTMAMMQMPVAHRWLLVVWVTVVMSATTLLTDWEPVGTTVPVMTLVYLGIAGHVCGGHARAPGGGEDARQLSGSPV